MAGIPHNSSIIADSTASSSPPRQVHHQQNSSDSNAASSVEPRINAPRIARTYGRPKANAVTESIPRAESPSRTRILKTAPRHADDQVIPESDDTDTLPPSFKGFAWREKLKEIDEDDSESGEQNIADTSLDQVHDASTTNQRFKELSNPFSESSTSGPSSLDAADVSPATVTEPLFDGTPSALLSSTNTSSSPVRESRHVHHSVPERSIALHGRCNPHKRDLRSPDHSDTDNTSPQHSYVIDSPNQRSSSTPPTSPFIKDPSLHRLSEEAEDPADDATKPERKTEQLRKGKGDGKGKRPEKRVKALTKREMLEMRKESARLLADQHVSIPHSTAHPTHTIANLFNKLRHTPASVTDNSDPITSFSSPRPVFWIPNGASLFGEHTPTKSAPPSEDVASNPKASTSPLSRVVSPEHDRISIPVSTKWDTDLPDPVALLPREQQDNQHQKVHDQEDPSDVHRKAKELDARKRKALEISQHRANVRRASSSNATTNSQTDSDIEIEPERYSRPHSYRSSESERIGRAGGRRIPVKKMRADGDASTSGSKSILKFPPRRHGIFESKTKSAQAKNKHATFETTPAEKSTLTSEPNRTLPKQLIYAAKSSFESGGGTRGSNRGKEENVFLSHKDLNNIILQRAKEQSSAIDEKKKDQWLKAGGLLKDQTKESTEEKSLADWLLKGSTRDDAMDVEESESDEDPDYKPELIGDREIEDPDTEAGEEDDDQMRIFDGEARRIDADADADTDKENLRPIPRRHSARAIIDSDDEDSIAVGEHGRPSVLVADTTVGEDNDQDSPGEDKENSAELAFDLSEDKENARVPRLLPRGRVLVEDRLRLSSPASSAPQTNEDRVDREPLCSLDTGGPVGNPFVLPPLAQSRDRVLQVLHEEDKDATLEPVASETKRLLGRSSPSASDDDAGKPPAVFSQLFVEPDDEEPAPGLIFGGGGFSQFFSQESNGSLSDRKARRLAQQSLSADDRQDFVFTQPNALLPSVRISESQRRAVDEMFDKDQEFKLNQAKISRIQEKGETPRNLRSLSFGSFVPSQSTQLSPQSIRRPLETLSLECGGSPSQLETSPGKQMFTRRRLLQERPPERHASELESSPSPPLRNAFDTLQKGASRHAAEKRLPRWKPPKSDYIEAEAQESDDDNKYGFGGAKENDDEVDDEEENLIVEGLVDDAVMDEKTQAAELVLEKHMEHQAEDDAALEKLHQDAVDGKFRAKRRDRGLGFEDSDSDDEFKGPCKPLYKKRRVDGDTLDAYGENPETRPFYDAYQADLAENDDPVLAYLQQRDTHLQGEGDVDDDNEDEPAEEIDVAEVRRQIRDISSRQLSASPELDLHNADWVDSDMREIDDEMPVKVQSWHDNKKTAKNTQSSSNLEHLSYRGSFKAKGTEASKAKLKTWASQEVKTHSSATGRGGFSRKEEGSRKRDKSSAMSKKNTPGSSRGDTTGPTRSSSLISQLEKRKGFDR